MPLIPYLYSLLSSLLTAAWVFLSAWFQDFIIGFAIDYIINMIVQFIKDEFLYPIEEWAKELIDEIATGIKAKIETVFTAINDLNETFNFFICDKFSLDYDALINQITGEITAKITEYSNDLIAFINEVFNYVLLPVDNLTALLIELETAINGGGELINASINDNVNGFANNAYSDITAYIAGLPIDESIKLGLYAKVNNATIVPANNAANTLTNLTTNTLTPVFNAANNINQRIADLRQLLTNKQTEAATYIQTKADAISAAITALINSIVTTSVKAWLGLLCDQATQVSKEIKASMDTLKADMITATDSANTYSKIALTQVETKLVAKVVHSTVSPHLQGLATEGGKKLEEEKLKFINSELSDFFDINETVQQIKAKLDAGIETEKTNHFTITDIQRILANYFNRDYRVALMLKIMESDLQLTVKTP